jgi:protein-export membrane protein SecD
MAIVRREEGETVDFSQFAFLSGEDALFIPTELTGRYLKAAQLNFGGQYSGQLSNEPIVLLEFNSEGSELFATITREHTNERLAIFLDGAPISIPVIIQEITGGTATISGGFSPAEARALVRDLNFGALPVPIELIETQAIGASLGSDALAGGVRAGLFGLMLVAAFMVLWYRLPGLLSVVALAFYIIAMLALFKLIPVTLTAAGIAGFILSIGMAVDANVLIFERMREELKAGKEMKEAVTTGFSRAWPSIRDGNVSSILTAIILFWFGTSLVKGFALVFGIGVLLSMLSAITVTRTFLQSLGGLPFRGVSRFLLGSGISL